MRIVAHNASPVLGGGEIWTARLLNGLRERGHEVLMLCRNAEVAGRVAAEGIVSRVLVLGGDALLSDALRLAWVLRRHGTQALLLTTFKKTWLGGLGARLARVPRVVARVAIAGQVPRNFTYRVAIRRLVDAVAFNAEALRAPFLATLPRLAPERLVTIYDGVSAPRRQTPTGTLRRALRLPPEAGVFGTLARLVPQKRLDRFVEALTLLPARVHCIVGGEGPERTALEAHAQRLGVAGRLHLIGFRSDVGDVLDALDVLALCSDREGMANSMLEAMAAGVPVVSTPVSGAAEALEPLADGEAPGILCGFDPRELAGAIHALLCDPSRRARMAEAGPRRVKERFSRRQMLDRWEAFLSARGQSPEKQDAGNRRRDRSARGPRP